MPTHLVLGVDPRAFGSQQIAAPSPLPHVSRRALRRVKDRVPIPTSCPFCSRNVELVRNDVIYGKQYGDWPYAYRCQPCDAYVGLHPHTDLPLGTLADSQTRKARKHKSRFIRLVKTRFKGNRSAAYAWLATELGLEVRLCHWGLFTAEQCQHALGAIQSLERSEHV